MADKSAVKAAIGKYRWTICTLLLFATTINYLESRATPAAVMAACCAAYGVPLRDPLNPTEPAEAQLTARPSGSVSVTIVLLNVAWMHTTPCGTTRFSRFFRNSFLRLDGFAAAGAAAAS